MKSPSEIEYPSCHLDYPARHPASEDIESSRRDSPKFAVNDSFILSTYYLPSSLGDYLAMPYIEHLITGPEGNS